MPRLLVVILLGLAGQAHAQDPVQMVLQAAPQLVSFAGSPANFQSLVVGLTQGTPVRLAAPPVEGFSRVIILRPGAPLPAAQVAAMLERAREDMALLGIAQPTPEQLSAALAGGVLNTPSGSTQLRGALERAQVRTELEADTRRPSPDEQAFARLPAEIQSLLRGLPLSEALRKVELAQQNLIALGVPAPSSEQLRAVVQRVVAPSYGAVESYSAGATTFPPLSPLVSPLVARSP